MAGTLKTIKSVRAENLWFLRDYEEPGSTAERAYGAQGRDRTTDTAIFSRMLYQLSYLGTSNPRGGLGAGVYSQAGQPCPPRFAFLSGIARRATTDG